MYLPFMQGLESQHVFLTQANINTYFGFTYSNTLGLFEEDEEEAGGENVETFHCSLMNQELFLEGITL